MTWIKFMRSKLDNTMEPTISISSEGRFTYNNPLVKLADLTKFKFVAYEFDPEDRKIRFEFLQEKNAHSYPLQNLDKIYKGVRSTALDLIKTCSWLKAVTRLRDSDQRKFLARKDGKYWEIILIPSFECKISRTESSKISLETRGIYRYVDSKNEIVYIGKGNIKARLNQPARKDWNFTIIEYSPIKDENKQYEWEYWWLEKFKEKNNGRLPYYNFNSGIGSKNEN